MIHKKNLSVKWKVFSYMLIFAAILVIVLWLCQIIYLESFYKFIKGREVEKALSDITDVLEESGGDIQEELGQIATDYGLCVRIVNEQGDDLYSVDTSFGCTIHSLTPDDLSMYYKETVDNGGRLVFTSDGEKRKYDEAPPPVHRKEDGFEDIKPPQRDGKRPIEDKLIEVKRGGSESMVSAAVTETGSESRFVLVDARLTPVDATVNTLRVELAVISVVMLVLALLLAFLVSRAISVPIIKVNNAAKELAKGNYDIVFEGRNYREISELSDTLNYTSGELARTERYQQELIANVSHDLRTPLTMITAYSEVMRDIPGENTPENVQVVIDEADRLTNLVNDLLDISKLQFGVIEKEAADYDLTESIRKVMERYSKLKLKDGYDIQFEYDEHVMVNADEFKIFQVIYNLINNAVNYTGDDKKVTVRQIATTDVVRIEVCDTGPGISKEELNNVWDRYYKASGSHKRALKGCGIGLSIVRDILKLHQAAYGVESREGEGSVFWFELERCDKGENLVL